MFEGVFFFLLSSALPFFFSIQFFLLSSRISYFFSGSSSPFVEHLICFIVSTYYRYNTVICVSTNQWTQPKNAFIIHCFILCILTFYFISSEQRFFRPYFFFSIFPLSVFTLYHFLSDAKEVIKWIGDKMCI